MWPNNFVKLAIFISTNNGRYRTTESEIKKIYMENFINAFLVIKQKKNIMLQTV